MNSINTANEYEYIKQKIREFLKQEGFATHYRVRFIYPKPSTSKMNYSYFVIVQTDGTHSRQVAKGYNGDEVMKNFCQYLTGLTSTEEAAALYERYRAFRVGLATKNQVSHILSDEYRSHILSATMMTMQTEHLWLNNEIETPMIYWNNQINKKVAQFIREKVKTNKNGIEKELRDIMRGAIQVLKESGKTVYRIEYVNMRGFGSVYVTCNKEKTISSLRYYISHSLIPLQEIVKMNPDEYVKQNNIKLEQEMRKIVCKAI